MMILMPPTPEPAELTDVTLDTAVWVFLDLVNGDEDDLAAFERMRTETFRALSIPPHWVRSSGDGAWNMRLDFWATLRQLARACPDMHREVVLHRAIARTYPGVVQEPANAVVLRGRVRSLIETHFAESEALGVPTQWVSFEAMGEDAACVLYDPAQA